MCHTHQTYHACNHTTTHATLCLASVASPLNRATTFPYVQGLPAVPPGTHNVVLSGDYSSDYCPACSKKAGRQRSKSQAIDNHDNFFHTTDADNGGDVLPTGVTVELRGGRQSSTLKPLSKYVGPLNPNPLPHRPTSPAPSRRSATTTTDQNLSSKGRDRAKKKTCSSRRGGDFCSMDNGEEFMNCSGANDKTGIDEDDKLNTLPVYGAGRSRLARVAPWSLAKL